MAQCITAASRLISRYVRVAPLPNLTAFIGVFVAFLLGRWTFQLWHQGHVFEAPVVAVLSLGWFVGGLCCQMDGVSRYREYQRIKKAFIRYGLDNRILHLVAPSRCQRDAALQAARETGLGCEALCVFRSLGYRWYHFLPDRIVANPFHFFSPAFLRTTFLPGKRARDYR